MKNTCPAAKVCPLRCEECTKLEGTCIRLLDGMTRFAKDNGWAEKRQSALQQTNRALHDAFIATLAELSVTPQHELVVRMLEETRHNSTSEMTAYEIYYWMKEARIE